MTTKAEFRDPPEGFELIWDCDAIDGDMYPIKYGWAWVDHPGRYYSVLARRKKTGLVELLDKACVETERTNDWHNFDNLRARLAEIEREPTPEEAAKWREDYFRNYTPYHCRAAIMAAREIGQTKETT